MTVTTEPVECASTVPDQVSRFVGALFEPDDPVLLRPIETWTEAGRKRSRVVYRQVRHVRARELMAEAGLWTDLTTMSEDQRANLFFGVCPRVEPKDGFDLAWQIRTVRCLWADLDDCPVPDAVRRCEEASLPRPTAAVKSGHGTHLYWRLAEAWLIDDVGPPDRVFKEFVTTAAGKKKAIPYRIDPATGAKRHDFPALSPKGRHVQDVIARVAHAVGGDHTHDLARLLRLPGTLNRKDQRNGKPTTRCELVECEPDRTYPLAAFEALPAAAAVTPAAPVVRLPTGRKLTPTRKNKLNDYINACAVADPGGRSEVDFALCAWAVEHGLDQGAVWAEVREIGKFAEGGEPYFQRTWAKAEAKARQTVHARACRRAGVRLAPPGKGAALPLTPPEGAGGDGPPPGPPSTGGDDSAEPPPEALDDPHRLARGWLDEHGRHPDGLRLRFYREQFWEWRATHWTEIPDAEIRARLSDFCKSLLDREHAAVVAAWAGDKPPPNVPKVTRELVTNVMQALGGLTLLTRDVPQPCWLGDAGPEERGLLALSNGVLDVDALLAGAQDVLRPHTPTWFSPVCLPYPFDVEAGCPTWLNVIHRNLGGDPELIGLFQQWAGYLLTPDTSYQKFLLMLGEGANGKSVFCAVLSALLGAGNVSSVPLELFADKFHLIETLGRLANVVAEIGELDRVAEGQLKAFVVGDAMLFERKYKQPFTAKPTARLVLATNNIPPFRDKSDGIWRRILLLKFRVQIQEAERIAGMDTVAYWTNLGELPGILNWALVGLHRLRTQGRFTIPAQARADLEEARTDANPARRFLFEHYQAGPGSTPTAAMYGRYAEWCRSTGHVPLADTNFGKEVTRAFPQARRGRLGSRGEREYGYIGVIPRGNG